MGHLETQLKSLKIRQPDHKKFDLNGYTASVFKSICKTEAGIAHDKVVYVTDSKGKVVLATFSTLTPKQAARNAVASVRIWGLNASDYDKD